MTLKELRSGVLVFLHEPEPGSEFTRLMINQWLNEAQHLLVRDTYCIQKTAEMPTVDGTERYQLPCDFLKIEQCAIGDDLIFPMHFGETMAPAYDDSGNLPLTGQPDKYYLFENAIGFRPIPDAVYSVLMRYRATPATLSGDTDVPDIPARHHHVLGWYAQWMGALKREDGRSAQAFERLWYQGLAGVKQETTFPGFDEPAQPRDLYFGQMGDPQPVTWRQVLGL